MFISVNQLEREMGVNKTIGRFFVDRKPPENNRFWEKKLLYLGLGNGYIFIPVYYDILFRIGLPVEMLLDYSHIHFMEQIMHFATMHELHEINFSEQLDRVQSLLKERVKDRVRYEALNCYLDQPTLKPTDSFGLPYPSLNRADVFLYILCDLSLSEMQWKRAVQYWYALLSSYLIQDDLRDYEKDKTKGEENVILDLGDGTRAFEKALGLLRENSETLDQVNPALARCLMNFIKEYRENIPLNIS